MDGAGAGACAACPTPTSSPGTATQRYGMITQKEPPWEDASDGVDVVMPGLSPSMRRRVGPISRASARYPGANAITGGWLSPDMLTGT